ncbi:hypothetical protein ACFLT8_04065 [Chloroflexota bacterium]
MTTARFIKFALPAIALPALIGLILPARIWPTYFDILEPISLLIGSLLACYISFMYRSELKVAYIFLSAFLFIYMVAIILLLSFSPVLLPYLESRLGGAETIFIVQGIQFINYAMLFLFCVNLLKVVDITKLNRNGWFIFVLTTVYCIFTAIYPKLDLIVNLRNLELPEISYLAVRILDAALIVILTPVIWLYVQHLKSQQRQSLAFTIVIIGIVWATLFDYLFELIMVIFPNLLGQDSHLLVTIPEALFIYGYLIIAVGLFAHCNQDKWGYDIIDRTTAGELKLVDTK